MRPVVALLVGLTMAASITSQGVARQHLRMGDRGLEVLQEQHLLYQVGYYPRAPDGIFGPLTESAVRRFESDQGLPVDGVIGPVTRAALQTQAGRAVRLAQAGSLSEWGQEVSGAQLILW